MKNIISIIRSNFDSMSDSHQQISKIILRNEKIIPRYTIQQLAKEANVSIASVSKFCKFLNLDGFDELRYLIKYSNASPNGLINLEENLLLSLSSTHENIIDSIPTIINLMRKNPIYIFARSNSANIAFDFFYKLKKIKNNVYFERSPERISELMIKISKGIIILVSNSGNSTELYELSKYIKKNKNIPIILITNNRLCKISKFSDYIIEGVPLEIDLVIKQHLPFSAKYSLMYCLDIIFINYFRLDYSNNLKKIKALQISGK